MSPWSFRGPLFAAACLVWLPPPGQGFPGATDNGPLFVLRTVPGECPRGPLAELRDGWTVRLGGPQRTRRKADEWYALRRGDRPPPAFPSGAHLVLAGGDRVAVEAASLRLADERFSFTHPALAGGRETRLPVSAVSALWLAPPDGEEDAEAYRRRLVAGRRRNDVVVLRNGDALEGVLASLGPKRLRIEVGTKPVAVELPKVAAVALSSDLATPLRPRGTFARLVLADGTRLSLASAAADGHTLTGTTPFGAALGVALDRVEALDLHGGPAVYLSDLKPVAYRHTPYLGVAWPLVADGSVAGRDLRLAGGAHDKGLGMHSASRATYALPAGARRFEALVGLDDHAGQKGSVRVRVLVDGKERDLGIAGELTHRGGPRAVRVDVAGAKELTLVVDFGAGGDVGDHVNWADARIVK